MKAVIYRSDEPLGKKIASIHAHYAYEFPATATEDDVVGIWPKITSTLRRFKYTEHNSEIVLDKTVWFVSILKGLCLPNLPYIIPHDGHGVYGLYAQLVAETAKKQSSKVILVRQGIAYGDKYGLTYNERCNPEIWKAEYRADEVLNRWIGLLENHRIIPEVIDTPEEIVSGSNQIVVSASYFYIQKNKEVGCAHFYPYPDAYDLSEGDCNGFLS